MMGKKMCLWPIGLFCFSRIVLGRPTNTGKVIFPPKGSFCLFTNSEFVFETIMTEIAPSAKCQGAGMLQNLFGYLPNLGDPVTASASSRNEVELRNLWGVVYFIAEEDYSKVEQYAYKQNMISDIMVNLQTNANQRAMECMTMDIGLLPQAFPLPIHSEFCQEICCKNYLDRLSQVGVPQDYIASLAMLSSESKDLPRSSSSSPASQELPSTSSDENDFPADKICIFAASDLMFPNAMTTIAPSATLTGAAMLMNEFIGLGGNTQPGHFPKYEGFDHIWGAAYTIDRKDLDNYLSYGQRYTFVADVRAVLQGQQETTCKTFDVGFLPSGFPFSVFHESQLDVKKYVSQLQNLGVPTNYVDSITSLENSVYSNTPADEQIDPASDSANKIGSWVY